MTFSSVVRVFGRRASALTTSSFYEGIFGPPPSYSSCVETPRRLSLTRPSSCLSSHCAHPLIETPKQSHCHPIQHRKIHVIGRLDQRQITHSPIRRGQVRGQEDGWGDQQDEEHLDILSDAGPLPDRDTLVPPHHGANAKRSMLQQFQLPQHKLMQQDGEKRRCFNCGSPRHLAAACPKPDRRRRALATAGDGDQFALAPLLCHNCGEEGHKWMDCPLPPLRKRVPGQRRHNLTARNDDLEDYGFDGPMGLPEPDRRQRETFQRQQLQIRRERLLADHEIQRKKLISRHMEERAQERGNELAGPHQALLQSQQEEYQTLLNRQLEEEEELINGIEEVGVGEVGVEEVEQRKLEGGSVEGVRMLRGVRDRLEMSELEEEGVQRTFLDEGLIKEETEVRKLKNGLEWPPEQETNDINRENELQLTHNQENELQSNKENQLQLRSENPLIKRRENRLRETPAARLEHYDQILSVDSLAILCYNCGRVGHKTVDCPKKKTCWNCGETGHISRECPDEVRCLRCGRYGHVKHDCPEGKLCFKCGRPGHLARFCNAPRRLEGGF